MRDGRQFLSSPNIRPHISLSRSPIPQEIQRFRPRQVGDVRGKFSGPLPASLADGVAIKTPGAGGLGFLVITASTIPVAYEISERLPVADDRLLVEPGEDPEGYIYSDSRC